ncbi:hypothetical protein G6F21_011690 [Rhizopus arrhizus]|nr:hypothetical protein G6F21_011690 [Rhizopus arrhizus]
MPKSLSADIKNDIKSALLAGKDSMDVASRLGVTYATVNNYANKFFPNRQRGLGGRPMVVSAQTKRFIKLQVVQGQLKAAREVHDKLMELGYSISYKTAINVLKSMNFFSAIKVKKPLLTTKHMKRRLAWAKKYQNWTTDDWRRVVFSDETKVNIWGSDGSVKHGGGSLIIVTYIDDWSAQSPDLNPIEHLWHHLKLKLSLYDKKAKGVHELWERVEKEWNSFDKEVCRRYIDTMPARIKAAIDAKGGSTKY